MAQPSNRAPHPATPDATSREQYEWLRPVLSSLLTPEQTVELHALREDHPWTAAVRRGWTSDDAVLAALAARYRMPVADLSHVASPVLNALRESVARKYNVLPIAFSEGSIEVATANPHDIECERALAFIIGRPVRLLLAAPHRIAERMDELYRPDHVIERIIARDFSGVDDVVPINEATVDDADGVVGSATDRPIIRLVDRIIAKAIRRHASDVHLEPDEHGVAVRYRIDGVLTDDSVLPRALSAPLVARVKIMARLDIADRLRPQDGRSRVAVGGTRIDLRVATLPASYGEKVVIRILDSRRTVLALEKLGIDDDDLVQIHAMLHAREGLIIVTGPTGSGKTTTLYSIVRQIQQRRVNIVTVEDPVEYRLKGIVQVQINEKTGLTFPVALRSILRQDPDVILIGEIRDRETAQIAVQAALTGHLVLSTLHTIDAASAVTRLSDLGIDAYKTAAALKGVLAQRLLRRLCAACRIARNEPLAREIRMYVLGEAAVFRAAGCADCAHTGYRSRLAICEVLITDPVVEARISANESAERIAQAARAAGMRSLWLSAVRQVSIGNTSVEELLRVFETPPSGAAIEMPTPQQPPVTTPRIDLFAGGAFELLEEFVDRAPPTKS